MNSEFRTVQLKVEEYFDMLQHSLSIDDFDIAQTYISRLSPYTHMFDEAQQDIYDWSMRFLDEAAEVDTFGGPTESEEWYSFNSDC